jgi:hypothetical protein
VSDDKDGNGFPPHPPGNVVYLDPTRPRRKKNKAAKSSEKDDKKGGGQKASDLILHGALATSELFHDAQERPFATIHYNDRKLTLSIESPKFGGWLARTGYRSLGKAPGKQQVEEARTQLKAIALFERPTLEVHVRCAAQENAIYVDLGDDSGECVAITPEGWEITTDVPVKFVRGTAMLPLPRPLRGGAIRDLQNVVNIEDEDSFVLVGAWMVSVYRTGFPVPGLVILGPQGSAKSTSAKLIGGLVDPKVAAQRACPKSEEDLIIAAQTSRVLSYDNLSGMPEWLSDALCRLITGGGLSKRKLYTDDTEFVIDVLRPVILNGIDYLATRPDLAERCIAIQLVQPTKRRLERDLKREFVAIAPGVLGAIFDGVASALRNLPNVRLDSLPRMADFIEWATAAEQGMGFPSHSVIRAFNANQQLAVDHLLEVDPLAGQVCSLAGGSGGFSGTASALLEALNENASDELRRARSWPKAPQTLSRKLNRLVPALRKVGIDVTIGWTGSGYDKRRAVDIKVAPEPSQPFQPSHPSTEKDLGRDDRDDWDDKSEVER